LNALYHRIDRHSIRGIWSNHDRILNPRGRTLQFFELGEDRPIPGKADSGYRHDDQRRQSHQAEGVVPIQGLAPTPCSNKGPAAQGPPKDEANETRKGEDQRTDRHDQLASPASRQASMDVNDCMGNRKPVSNSGKRSRVGIQEYPSSSISFGTDLGAVGTKGVKMRFRNAQMVDLQGRVGGLIAIDRFPNRKRSPHRIELEKFFVLPPKKVSLENQERPR
jgi:hypothetical protein